ncbi:putative acyl-CoA dehydrogenase [Venustampulla echinocandica]|uniref:Putative acyl-CoA dehydrogenase n=1 Tax=Venustampulla echinocandica TaxID=2656787 RepID=A0A370TBU4_9HELO|nr:putative acyl-CoA dehydrogenase [Venustampulla echinocandica]RDL31528.1 putative acyl-CoA dehydrogenase [Venustampulla echinocandica]
MSQAFGCPTPYAEPLWYSRNVSPHYTDSHRKLRAAAFKRHAELGYLALSTGLSNVPLPGGIPFEEWDSWHTLIVSDELTRVGYTGVSWGLGGGNGIGVPPIVNFGTQALKDKFLPGVADGSIRFCLGITEPDAGSDVANIKTTAIRKGDQYIVNGSKKWITNGIWADYVTAAVRTGGPGATGISLLIIPLAAPGVSRRLMHNSGVGASGSTFITLDDVSVPVSNLIHKENRGFEVIMSNFNAERKAIATQSIRLSRVCVEDAWQHACTRETFGKKLIENPIIRAKFVKMGRMIEPAQAFLEQLTWLIELERKNEGNGASDVRIGGMTAMLKVVSTRCLEKCVREAQQVMGGLGYARGGKGGRIEAISRDVRVMAVGGGSEEIMSELAIREETKDLRKYSKPPSKL